MLILLYISRTIMNQSKKWQKSWHSHSRNVDFRSKCTFKYFLGQNSILRNNENNDFWQKIFCTRFFHMYTSNICEGKKISWPSLSKGGQIVRFLQTMALKPSVRVGSCGDHLLSWRSTCGTKGKSPRLSNPEILGGGSYAPPPIPTLHGPDVSLRRVN